MARENEPYEVGHIMDTLNCPLCNDITLDIYEREYGRCRNCGFDGKIKIKKVKKEPEDVKCVMYENELYCAVLPEDDEDKE